MRKNLNRVLAVALALALLITCSISGLVLPAMADSSAIVNLLEGKLAAAYTVAPGKASYPEATNMSLISGERYVMRLEAKGSNGYVSFNDGNGAWRRQNVTDTGDNWRVYQVVFTANGASGKFSGEIKNEGSTNDLVVRNIELYRAPTDGSFDIMVGGSMDVQTEMFKRQFDGANGGPQIVTDPDDPNNSVMYFPKASDTNVYATRYSDIHEVISFNANTVYKFTFRMKGFLRLTCYADSPTYLPNPDAASITGSGRHTHFVSENGWSTFSYYIKVGANPQNIEFWNVIDYGSSRELWLDDFQIYELPEPTALAMNKSEVAVYPGNNVQLSVTTTPQFAYAPADAITWSSTSELVTVDSTGLVKAATTAPFGTEATITAKYSNTVYATCVVTVDDGAPKPPDYTVPGVDGFKNIDTGRVLTGGGEAVEITSNVLLKANTRYALRYTTKGTAGNIVIAHNGSVNTKSVAATENWQAGQVLFTTTEAGATFKVTVTPPADAGASFEIKDVQLFEAPADGTFNLLPGSTCDAESVVFAQSFAAGVKLADVDATNKAMYWDATYDARWVPNGVFNSQVSTKMFRLTFRYKGNLRLWDGMDGGYFIDYTGASNFSGNGGNGAPAYLYYSSTDWQEATIIFDAGSIGQMEWMYWRRESGTLYIDDVCLYEVPSTTGLSLNLSELTLYPQNTEQLKVTAVPTTSYLDLTRVTWKSSDDSIVTVDAFGNVKAVGTDGQTATITAMLDGTDAATCVVTVDLTAPKPPVETQPGVNAMEEVKDGAYTADQQIEIKSGAILKAGTRYVLRFTTNSNVAGATVLTNATEDPYVIPQTTAWRANQIMFTPAARVDHLIITVKTPAGLEIAVNVKDWELYEAPADGTFNIIPGSDSNAESAFFTNHFAAGGTTLVADPDDATNTVINFSDTSALKYFGIKNIGGYQSGKVWKLTFRMKGAFRIGNWGSGAVTVSQPDAVLVKSAYTYFASEDWKTVTFYIQPSSMSQAEWIEIGNYSVSGGKINSYMDDVQLYEMTPSSSLSIVEQDLRLYPTSTQQLTYTWSEAGSVLVGGDIEWSSSNTSVVVVDAKTGRITLVGDPGQSAVITAKNSVHTAVTTVTVDDTAEHAPQVTSVTLRAPLGEDMDIGQQSQLLMVGTPIDNLVGRTTWTTTDDRIVSVDAKGNIVALGAGTATVTGTTEFGRSASITITVYRTANLLINGDFEQGSKISWKESSNVQDGKGQYGSVGYVINGESSTFYSQDILLKPGTKYEISYRYKAEAGANFRMYTGWSGASNVTPSTFVEAGTLEEAEWSRASTVFTTADFFALEVGYAFSFTTSECDNEGKHVSAYIDNVAIREYIIGESVESMTIDQQNISLAPGRFTKLTYKVTPDSADTNMFTWTSSNEQVAYVVSGNVYAVGAGEAVITATAKSGATATTTVTVNGAPAPLQNGTFETADDPATPDENELVWSINDKVTYEEGKGVIRTNAVKLVEGGIVSQTFKGLKPGTQYQFQCRHIQRDTNGQFAMTITNAAGQKIVEVTGGGKATRRVTFQKDTTNLAFVTPDDITENDEFTVEFAFLDGDEYMMLDTVSIVEAASEVDLIVSDITWSHDSADQVTPGTEIEFYVSIVNQGTEAYVGNKPFTIDILVDSQKVKELKYEGTVDVGEMLIVKQDPADAWVATLGDHTITAVVNSTMTILENDDSNNHYSVNLRVAEEEDFVKAPDAAIKMGHNRLIFSDHFTNNLTIDHTASGNPGYKWYITRPWGEANLTQDDYRVEDGVLYLTTVKTAWNYSMCTIDAKTPGVGFSFNTGYMEIRLRMKETADTGKVDKIRVPAVWAFSDETIWGTRPAGKDSLELDWIEYWGDKYGKPRFDTTLHHTRVNSETGKDMGKVTSGQKHYEPIGDYQWHTYAMGWNKGVLKTYFDGELIGTQRYSEDGYPDPLPTGSINVEAGGADPFEGLFSILDEQNMPIILGGASDFPLEVDWIHVWQSDGSIEPVEDVEVDNSHYAFINEYLRENGQLITELTADNYEKILAGEAEYLNLTSAQRAAINAVIGADYLDWLSEIYSTQGIVNNFVSFYACAEDGTPYITVDGSNAAWIAGSLEEWDTLSAFAKALINRKVKEQSGMTFEELLTLALEYDGPLDEDTRRPGGSIDLTWLWIALIAVGALIVAGGIVIVVLLFVKKKKKGEGQPQ